jgi:hypothetical protein
MNTMTTNRQNIFILFHQVESEVIHTPSPISDHRPLQPRTGCAMLNTPRRTRINHHANRGRKKAGIDTTSIPAFGGNA